MGRARQGMARGGAAGDHGAVDPQALVGTIAQLMERAGPYAPALLFLAAFVEYVFPPAPGDAMVLLGAWWATHGRLGWPLTFFLVTAGAIAGAVVDHAAGRWIGSRVEAQAGRGWLRWLDRSQLDRFEAGYRRWGGLFLVVNRFLPGIRGLFFVAAGLCHIPRWQVLLYGGVSAMAWNGLLLVAGAYAARNLEHLLELFVRYTTVAWGVVALGLLVAAAVWFRQRRRP